MQAKIKTIKTISKSKVKDFDNDINELVKAGWQILGPPVVVVDDHHVYYVQQLGQIEAVSGPLTM